MTLKTSSFKINKTILKKNVVRFWPIWVLYTVVVICMLPVMLYTRVKNTIEWSWEDGPQVLAMNKTTDLLSIMNYSMKPAVIAVFAILAAVAVFSYLYASRSCNMMHAFPVKRTELFATHYVSGILFMIVPQVIAYLISLAVCGVLDIPNMKYLGIWLLLMIGMTFLFYSIAGFCCMLTGNLFAAIGFFALFNVIYAAVAAMWVYLADRICYGIGSNVDIPGMALSPILWLSSGGVLGTDYEIVDLVLTEITITGGKTVGLYCIPAVIFILLSVLLYKRRHLECAAEVSAHKFVKPLLRWMATILAGMGLALLFTETFFSGMQHYLIIWILAWIVISWAIFFVLEMIINKKFRVFKKCRFLEWGLCAAAILIVAGLLEFDAFGIEKKMPALADIKGVDVSANSDMVLTEPEDIQRVLEIHQTILDEKNAYEDAYYALGQTTCTVDIVYYLADGERLIRSYPVPDTEDYLADEASAAAQIRSLQEDTDAYLKSWLCVNYEDADIAGGYCYIYNDEGKEIELTKEEANQIYQAYLEDVKDGNLAYSYIGPEASEEIYYGSCDITLNCLFEEMPVTIYDLMQELQGWEEDDYYDEYTLEDYGYSYKVKQPDGFYHMDGYISVESYSEHTIQALIDLGIIDSADEILEEIEYEEYYEEY